MNIFFQLFPINPNLTDSSKLHAQRFAATQFVPVDVFVAKYLGSLLDVCSNGILGMCLRKKCSTKSLVFCE